MECHIYLHKTALWFNCLFFLILASAGLSKVFYVHRSVLFPTSTMKHTPSTLFFPCLVVFKFLIKLLSLKRQWQKLWIMCDIYDLALGGLALTCFFFCFLQFPKGDVPEWVCNAMEVAGVDISTCCAPITSWHD